ncbi:MAG: AMP-binding protein [Desulfovibrio sp.]
MIYSEFLARAEETPDKQALSGPDCMLTYAMLERASRALALTLLDHDKHSPVIILSERGPEVIVGMLACLRSGKPFAAIDPAYPPRRIEQLIGICKGGRVLHHLKDGGLPLDIARMPCTEIQIPALLDARPGPLDHATVSSNDPAYLLFTSGTTGTPKCVACHHDPLVNFVGWQVRTFGLTASDRFSMLSGLSHDPVMRDIFTPLSIGASILIPAQASILRPGGLREWMVREQPSVAHMTPPLGQILTAGDSGERIGTLRYVFWGGDALRTELIERMARIAPNCTHVNFYGATETPQAASFHVYKDDPDEAGVVPIGVGIDGFALRIVDDKGQECPSGSVGTIVVDSPYLNLGYVQDGVLPPPLAAPEVRSYATGDRGRLREDGVVAILGRADDQVKVRGYRVEMSEISAQIKACAGVSQALTINTGCGDCVRLCSFITTSCTVECASLKAFLAERVPSYMVPENIIVLDCMPLLPNGKVDRKALAQLDADPTDLPMEQRFQELDPDGVKLLADIEKITRCKIPDLDQSFSSIGADSLSFINVFLLLEQHLPSMPLDWDKLPFRALLRQRAALSGTEKRPAAGLWSWLETVVLLRAISITMVVLTHTGKFHLYGTTILFFLSGHSFGKYLAPTIIKTGNPKAVFKFILKFGIPAFLWQVMRAYYLHFWWIPNLILLGTMWQNPEHPLITFWFLDMLAVNILLLTSLIMGLRALAVRKRAKEFTISFPLTLAVTAVGVGLAYAQVRLDIWNGSLNQSSLGPFPFFWLIALGWAASLAESARKKLVVTAMLAVLALLQSFETPFSAAVLAEIPWYFYCSLLVCLWIRRIAIPRPVRSVILVVANSSLFIYIVNWSVIHRMLPPLGVPAHWFIQTCAATFVGVCAYYSWTFLTNAFFAAKDRLGARLRSSARQRQSIGQDV